MVLHLRRLGAVLFPSWSFFTNEAGKPELEHRWVGPQGEVGPWLPTLAPARRSWRGMVWNPEENLRYAVQSLVERALADFADEPGAVPVSMELVRNAVRYSSRSAVRSSDRAAGAVVPPGDQLQFRIRLPRSGVAEAEEDRDGVLSDPFPLEVSGEEGGA